MAREPLTVAQHLARATDCYRQQRHASTRGEHEGAHVESTQAWFAGKSPLGEEHQGLASLQHLGQALGVCGAALQVGAFDEAGAKLVQEQAGDPLASQFTLGNEAELRWQGCAENDAVEVAGMVCGQHAHPTLRQLLQPRDAERYTRQAQKQP
ncbi:hypothetical protein D9M71_283680 [compost metagenome]